MLALFWLLFNRKFILLPVLGLFGALAKESFVPMAAVATACWAIIEFMNGRWKLKQTLWALSMILVGLCTVAVLVFHVTGSPMWPWQLASELRAEGDVSLFRGLIGTVMNHYFWSVVSG